MTTDNFKIRQMNRSELDLALDWAADEGWNPGIGDAECFYQTDRYGFFVGELNGEPVGCISAVTYNRHFGFIGFYIVKPEFRGQGLGIQLWKAAIAHLGSARNIGLDGVIAQQDNYKKYGFQIAYNHIRYQGTGGGTVPPNVVELKNVPFPELVTYDRQLFPTERSHFLQSWISPSQRSAFGVVKGKLTGYGVIRESRTGFRIGPLFADDQQTAEQILLALLAKCPDAPVFIDVPDVNKAAIALVQSYGMKPVFETARMYTKGMPCLPINRIFGVTTLEIG
jgi:ribosomal protein S18 acetylase RimI-like enzyme